MNILRDITTYSLIYCPLVHTNCLSFVLCDSVFILLWTNLIWPLVSNLWPIHHSAYCFKSIVRVGDYGVCYWHFVCLMVLAVTLAVGKIVVLELVNGHGKQALLICWCHQKHFFIFFAMFRSWLFEAYWCR